MTLDTYTLPDADACVAQAWASAWAVRDVALPSVWAQRHRIVTAAASAEAGEWDNARTPYLVEIMDRMHPSDPCEFIVVRKPTQWGGTEVLINVDGWLMAEREPCSVGFIVPGLGMAKRHMRQRIRPSIAASDAWRAAVPKTNSRDGSNSTFETQYQGGAGIQFMLTANSSEGLRAMPLCVVLGDEVSKWKRDLDGEGSALDQAIARTSSYQGMRKVLLVSSPTIDGVCQISDWLENKTDWRELHLPCPHCGEFHTLDFAHLQPDGRMVCPHCGATFDESHKTAMLAAHRWVPRYPDRDPRYVGYDANALYTPIRMGDSWVDLAAQKAEAEADPAKAVKFTQQKLGKPYKGKRERQEFETLKARAEVGLYAGRVPDGYHILTCGVDFQADRAEGQVIAWGRGERGFVVDYWVVDCDPTDPEHGFDAVDGALQRVYTKRGAGITVQCAALDGGNWTESVAGFVRSRKRRLIACGDGHAEQHLVLCRGRSAPSPRVVHRPANTETTVRGKTLTVATAVGMWGVGTSAAKTILFQRIGADAQRGPDLRALRFPAGVKRGDAIVGGLTDHYYKGLTAEYWDHALGEWVHDKALRNEPTDTLVYAYFAALHPLVRLDLKTDAEWRALAARWEPPLDLLSPQQAIADDAVQPITSPLPAAPKPLQPVRPRVPDSDAYGIGSNSWSTRL